MSPASTGGVAATLAPVSAGTDCDGQHDGDPLTRLHDDMDELVRRLDDLDEPTRRKIPDVTVLVALTDLRLLFTGRLQEGSLLDRTEGPLVDPLPGLDVRVSTTAPVLHDIVHHQLSFVSAWTGRRIGVRASPAILLSLRRFL